VTWSRHVIGYDDLGAAALLALAARGRFQPGRINAAALGGPGPAWQHFRGPDGNVYEPVTS
jgi:hypothetical protein